MVFVGTFLELTSLDSVLVTGRISFPVKDNLMEVKFSNMGELACP